MNPGATRYGLREFRQPWLWLGVWAFGWALCIALSLLPPVPLDLDVRASDKIGHLLAYAVLSAWAVAIFARRRAHGWSALALLALGIALEFAQAMLTADRQAEAADVLADALGIALGQLLALAPAQTLLQRAESRFLSPS